MSFFDIIYCFALGIPMIIAISILFHEKRAGISPTPTMPGARRVVIDLVRKYVDTSRALHIAELGSGWGGLAIRLAKSFPSATVTGFEISPWPLLISRILTISNQRVDIVNEDFFLQDWSRYDVLVCYLSPHHMARIQERLHDLKRKPLLISCAFPMPNITPTETITIRQLVNVNVYVYNWKPNDLTDH